MRATFVNLNGKFTTTFINRNCIINDRPEENRLFLCFIFVPDDVPIGGGGGRDFVMPFVWNWLLEGCLLSNPFPPSLVE